MPDRAWQRVGSACVLALIHGACWVGATAAQPTAEALSSRFRDAARQTLPAVVTVRPQSATGPLGGKQVTRAIRDGGSGVVVDAARGLVVTNDHVIAGAARGVIVILGNGRERPASQVWRDPKSDLALLAIDPTDLVAAPWGDSNRLDIGDWVLAIGGPFGLSGTVTAGIISGKGRVIGMALYEDLIQTDAAINPGNSGGPLINLQGEVVGINTALKSNGGGYEGVGFAVPASRARRVVAELAEFGRVRRAYLGITIRPLDADTATRLNLTEGAVVSSVVVGGPAAAAGMQPGDVILTVAGQPTGGAGSLQGMIEIARVGEPLDLTLDRRGQVFAVQVRPEPQPESFGLPTNQITTAVAPTTAIMPGEVVVPNPRRGLHINVPGVNMRLPGPNLDITPFGVARRPRSVVVAPGQVGEYVVAGPLGPVTVPNPSGPTVVTTPGSVPVLEAEPDLHPVDPVPTPTTVPSSIPPALPVPLETSSRSANFAALGLNLSEPTPALMDRYHLDRTVSGLVVTDVTPNTAADRGGLEPGMVVTDAGGKLVGNLADFRQVLAVRVPGRDLLVRIKKGSKSEFRVVVAPDQATATEPTLDPLPPPVPRPL